MKSTFIFAFFCFIAIQAVVADFNIDVFDECIGSEDNILTLNQTVTSQNPPVSSTSSCTAQAFASGSCDNLLGCYRDSIIEITEASAGFVASTKVLAATKGGMKGQIELRAESTMFGTSTITYDGKSLVILPTGLNGLDFTSSDNSSAFQLYLTAESGGGFTIVAYSESLLSNCSLSADFPASTQDQLNSDSVEPTTFPISQFSQGCDWTNIGAVTINFLIGGGGLRVNIHKFSFVQTVQVTPTPSPSPSFSPAASLNSESPSVTLKVDSSRTLESASASVTAKEESPSATRTKEGVAESASSTPSISRTNNREEPTREVASVAPSTSPTRTKEGVESQSPSATTKEQEPTREAPSASLTRTKEGVESKSPSASAKEQDSSRSPSATRTKEGVQSENPSKSPTRTKEGAASQSASRTNNSEQPSKAPSTSEFVRPSASSAQTRTPSPSVSCQKCQVATGEVKGNTTTVVDAGEGSVSAPPASFNNGTTIIAAVVSEGQVGVNPQTLSVPRVAVLLQVTAQNSQGNLVQPSGQIQLCFTVSVSVNIDALCLAYINPNERWLCQDFNVTFVGPSICGFTDHFTVFSLLEKAVVLDAADETFTPSPSRTSNPSSTQTSEPNNNNNSNGSSSDNEGSSDASSIATGWFLCFVLLAALL